MSQRWIRIAYVVFGLIAIATGIQGLVKGDGDSVWGGLQVAFGVGWLLMAFFLPRYAARNQAWMDRQRSRVEGFGAMSFLPDSDSDPQDR